MQEFLTITMSLLLAARMGQAYLGSVLSRSAVNGRHSPASRPSGNASHGRCGR
jgi:hypothetical protein